MGVVIESLGGGRFLVQGELTFSTVTEALAASKQLFAEYQALQFDLSAVTEADSAGLALLLEWLVWAKRCDRHVSYSNVPARLAALARISEIDELLPLA